MRVRHRVPSIFNISMVDVLCCALGCVLLLWLVNMRDARDRAEAASETGQLLSATQANLDETTRKADETRKRLATVEDQARAAEEWAKKLRADRDGTLKELEAARARLARLDEQLIIDAERLAKLDKEKRAALRRVADLEVLTREKDKVASAAGKRAEDLIQQMLELEKQLKQMAQLAELVPGLRKEIQERNAKLTDAEKRALALQRDLSTAGQRITLLQGTQATLTEQVARARAEAENRFAGIELTGRRVAFLVDMSGSMAYVDSETAAPNKWPGVIDALVKIMRSLPELTHFQLILFSDKNLYPLGGEGQWLPYDPATSPDLVRKAMITITPKGNTNMYSAFEAAFKLRAQGLDTIYLFSDGLPNLGEGLSAALAKSTNELERGAALGKHIRTKLRTDWNAAPAGKPRVRVHAVGFFYESPDLGAFLWALSRENDGSFVGMSKP